MDTLYGQTHTPDAKCFSRFYNSLMYERMGENSNSPRMIRLVGERDFVPKNVFGKMVHFDFLLYEHKEFPRLYGMDMRTKLYIEFSKHHYKTYISYGVPLCVRDCSNSNIIYPGVEVRLFFPFLDAEPYPSQITKR